MADGIYTALSGAIAQQQALDVVANNVANASTRGFRGDRVVFGELLAGATGQNSATPGQAQPAPEGPPKPVDVARHVQVESTVIDGSSGVMVRTGNALDVALNGKGFFVVETPQGPRYTRGGGFSLDAEGTLKTSAGHAVHGQNGPIRLPPGAHDIQIAEDGTIRANGQDSGKLQIVQFGNPALLQKEGLTLFSTPTGVNPVPDLQTTTIQGHIESSNVNAMAGLNELITINRTFDAMQKVIDSFSKLDERTARELGSRG